MSACGGGGSDFICSIASPPPPPSPPPHIIHIIIIIKMCGNRPDGGTRIRRRTRRRTRCRVHARAGRNWPRGPHTTIGRYTILYTTRAAHIIIIYYGVPRALAREKPFLTRPPPPPTFISYHQSVHILYVFPFNLFTTVPTLRSVTRYGPLSSTTLWGSLR